MPKMRFKEDKFVDGKLTYHKNKTYEIAVGSVDRWILRGGELVLEGSASDEESAAQLDVGLAHNLEKEGVGTHDETMDAMKHADAVANDDEFEDIEEEHEEPGTGKKTTTKKKVAKKTRR